MDWQPIAHSTFLFLAGFLTYWIGRKDGFRDGSLHAYSRVLKLVEDKVTKEEEKKEAQDKAPVT